MMPLNLVKGPLSETRKSFIAFWLLIFQALAVVVIAIYFALVTADQNAVLASHTNELSRQARAATELNRVVIREVRRDLTVHAHASAERTCAVARELHAIITVNPVYDPVEDTILPYVARACRVVPLETKP